MTGLARPIKSGKSPPSYQEYYGRARHAMSSARFCVTGFGEAGTTCARVLDAGP